MPFQYKMKSDKTKYVIVDDDWDPDDKPKFTGTIDELKNKVFAEWLENGEMFGYKLMEKKEFKKLINKY